MKPLIHFENVFVSFGKNAVLKGLNLKVEEGEVLTILGKSGSGKSVALKLLLGILFPSRGSIYFRGDDVTKMSEEALIGMRKDYV